MIIIAIVSSYTAAACSSYVVRVRYRKHRQHIIYMSCAVYQFSLMSGASNNSYRLAFRGAKSEFMVKLRSQLQSVERDN